jgi:hypothetical protein
MSTSRTRTDLPPPSSNNFDQRVRETLMTYLGRQGNKLDRGLTLRDLLDAGLIELKPGFDWNDIGSGNMPIGPGPNAGGQETPDLTPPPTPTGVVVTGAISNFFVETDNPTFLVGHGYGRTNLYGVTYDGTGPEPTFSDAIKLASWSGEVFAQPSNPATIWRVWVKWETRDGVESVSPAGGTNGFSVTTGQDVTKLVEAMTGPGKPFMIVTEPTTLPDGTVVPPGTYTSDAYIHNGQITNAKIANLAVDNAKVANMSVSKLTAGSLAVGQYVRSTGYVPGSAGFNMDGNGNVEFSNAVVRGAIFASSGTFAGSLQAATGTFNGNLSAATGTFNGGVKSSNMAGYDWPPVGQRGYYLGPGGLLMGNGRAGAGGQYFQYEDSSGNIWMPGLSITGGNATFTGTINVGWNGSGNYLQITNSLITVVVGGVLRCRMGFW